MEKKTIGRFLTALRKTSGMTQRQLAEKLNVSDKAVSRWERDECTPDLSLIPVLAEIYGVTSDEILRGQRTNPDASPREPDTTKTEKQRKRLLASSQTKFRISSLISIVIAVIGLISACTCNFELGEANLGFLISSVFFITAIVCQIAFLVFGLLCIKDEEWASPDLFNCKCSMILWSEAIISGVVLLFAATLPLAGASHETIPFHVCLTEGLRSILVAALLCFIACLIANLTKLRRTKSQMVRMQLIFAGALSLLLIVSLIGHNVLNVYLKNNLQDYGPHKEFSSLQAFRSYIETPKTPEGFPLRSNHSYNYSTETFSFYCIENFEEYVLHADDVTKSVFKGKKPEEYPSGATVIPEPDFFTAEYGYVFQHLNRNVVHYVISENEDHLPIYVFTAKQYDDAMQIAQNISIRYTLTYLIIILIGTAVYLPLRKRYA